MRIAAVRYINALPLLQGLENHAQVELSYETPAECYRKLVDGQVDLGLIPVIGTQTSSIVQCVKGLGIASSGPCESVYLFARKPLDQVRTVATDEASLTSVALLKILFRKKYHNNPEFHSTSVQNIHELMRKFDAVLVIGDDAILAEKTDYDHYDLATEWYSLTGLSFVFAVWGANRSLSNEEQLLLHQAYAEANANWPDVFHKAQAMLAVDQEFLKRYYNKNLRYRLVRSDYEGLLKFFSFAFELGFSDRIRKEIWM